MKNERTHSQETDSQCRRPYRFWRAAAAFAFALLAICAKAQERPLALVQSADYFSGVLVDTSATLTLPTKADAGDLIVVWVRWGAIPTVATVSDTLNNTWTPVSDAIESSAHGAWRADVLYDEQGQRQQHH
jgi:hypothetical protein